jgi:hypothetical protein
MVEQDPDDVLRDVPVETGRERITNDAEYLGLGAARCALFPSSMRFFVALDASSDHVTQQK